MHPLNIFISWKLSKEEMSVNLNIFWNKQVWILLIYESPPKTFIKAVELILVIVSKDT